MGKVLRRLARVPSPTGKNDKMAPLVAELMTLAGLKVPPQPVDLGRSNIIGRMGRGNRLVFCSHLDTVAVGDSHAWHHPPLAAMWRTASCMDGGMPGCSRRAATCGPSGNRSCPRW